MKKNGNTFNLMLPFNIIWLRMLAVFFVYLGHSQLHICGGYGAVFFLTLSGYIFTRLFLKDQFENNETFLSVFILKRLQKILPVLTVLVGIGLIAKFILHLPIDYIQILSVFTFTTNYYNAIEGHLNNGFAHLWTLSVHMQFCFFYFLTFKYFKEKKSLNLFLAGVILACLGYRCFLVLMKWGSDPYIYNSFETRMDALALGALFALNIKYFHEHKFWPKLRHPWAFVLNLIGIYFAGKLTLEWRDSIGFFIQSILYCVLIYQVLGLEKNLGEVKYYNLLNLLCFWFYFFHPWGFSIGHYLPFSTTWQTIFGAIILIIIMILFFFIKEKAKKEFKVVIDSFKERA